MYSPRLAANETTATAVIQPLAGWPRDPIAPSARTRDSPPRYSDGSQTRAFDHAGRVASSHDRLPANRVPKTFGQASSMTRIGSRLNG